MVASVGTEELEYLKNELMNGKFWYKLSSIVFIKNIHNKYCVIIAYRIPFTFVYKNSLLLEEKWEVYITF